MAYNITDDDDDLVIAFERIVADDPENPMPNPMVTMPRPLLKRLVQLARKGHDA